MKIHFTLSLSFFLYCLLWGQSSVNLIPNPSFEDINTCQKYHEQCSPKAWRATELKNFKWPEYNPGKEHFFKPPEGRRSAVIGLYNERKKQDRQYLQVPFLCPLKKGEQYQLSLYFRPEEVMLKQFGVFFADTLQIFKENEVLLDQEPQIIFTFDDKLPPQTWQKLETTYTAKGDEVGCIIGNFQNDEATETLDLVKMTKKRRRQYRTWRVYYAFDNVKLIPLNRDGMDCDLRVNQHFIYQDSLRHIPNSSVKTARYVTILDKEEFYQRPVPKKSKPKPSHVHIKDATIAVNKPFTLSNINFETNSETLLDSSFPILDEIVVFLEKNADFRLKIIGHTDDVGSPMFNQQLSEDRARSVARYLIQSGISPNKIVTQGKGETQPIADNWSEEGKRKNRRVEFILY